jgi:hypothetical protein
MKVISLAALFLVSAVGLSQAANEPDMFTCAGIKVDADRLSCFDALAKMMLARQTNLPENYILQRFKKPADK